MTTTTTTTTTTATITKTLYNASLHLRYLSEAATSLTNSTGNNSTGNSTTTTNTTTIHEKFDKAEEEHAEDASISFSLLLTIIGSLLLAYYVKHNRIYYLPESAGAMVFGMAIGAVARLTTDNLALLEFKPEVFFFVLLPPIIFEAGYSLNRKDFFENIGAITLYAMFGTVISCFVVGLGSFYVAKWGIVSDIDNENPMEALLFGALISAVDPVATLSIMGNPELQCDPLLYSLVFGESVLNDAIAIVLFNTFLRYYNPEGPDWSQAEIPSALLAFVMVSFFSIMVGVGLGLAASFMYKHTTLSDYPKLETALLFCFCYLCYSTAEALELSGIMALFFNGIVLSHYNSYNLSTTAHVASEQLFATLATITETIVFVYMGMGVFTGRYKHWDILFSLLGFTFCLVGRVLNIFPLSFVANQCRRRGRNRIPFRMQAVLWFAGLRGAIAFALSENMPGPNKETYTTATLSICIFTTVVCGGLTEYVLTSAGMKAGENRNDDDDDVNDDLEPLNNNNNNEDIFHRRVSGRVYEGAKGMWKKLDNQYLKVYFGGSQRVRSAEDDTRHLGNYELTSRIEQALEDDDELEELETY